MYSCGFIAAMVAFERPFSCVNSQMYLKVPWKRRCEVTLLAFERFFSCVALGDTF